MTTYGEFDTLLEKVRDAERAARRRAVLLLTLSILIAGGLLVYTTWRFAVYQREADALTNKNDAMKVEIEAKKAEIVRLGKERDTAQQQLDQAISLGAYVIDFDWHRAKMIASRNPIEGELLTAIMEQKLFGDIRWRVDGTSPEAGFDSPNFAFFILRETGRLPPALASAESGDVSSQILKEAFPPADRPRFGDLAFYPGGFVMFHFIDERSKPFVAGMTPFGILALAPDFGSSVEYRRIGS